MVVAVMAVGTIVVVGVVRVEVPGGRRLMLLLVVVLLLVLVVIVWLVVMLQRYFIR